MLKREELAQAAELKGLPERLAELDYLQDIALISICREFGNKLAFKGGTCLYKIYKLNRFSEDLDFSLNGKVDLEKTVAKLRRDLGLLGIACRVKEVKKFENETNVRLLLRGPLFHGRPEEECFIPLNISSRERIALQPKRELVVSAYPDVPAFTVFAMDEREILAEKIRAVFSRESPRDVYDAWFLLVKKGVPFDASITSRKLKLARARFDAGNFLERIESKKAMWQKDLEPLALGPLPTFTSVKTDIERTIAEQPKQ